MTELAGVKNENMAHSGEEPKPNNLFGKNKYKVGSLKP